MLQPRASPALLSAEPLPTGRPKRSRFGLNCQDDDCVHEGAVLHPLAMLPAAALADADREGRVSGQDQLADAFGSTMTGRRSR